MQEQSIDHILNQIRSSELTGDMINVIQNRLNEAEEIIAASNTEEEAISVSDDSANESPDERYNEESLLMPSEESKRNIDSLNLLLKVIDTCPTQYENKKIAPYYSTMDLSEEELERMEDKELYDLENNLKTLLDKISIEKKRVSIIL